MMMKDTYNITEHTGVFNIFCMYRSLTETQKASKYQVGSYRVFLDNFEAVALPVLDSDTVRSNGYP